MPPVPPATHGQSSPNSAWAGTRRRFLRSLGSISVAAGALAAGVRNSRPIPVGLQMYSVRGEEKRDLMATLQAVQGMGYECIEFWAPYTAWTPTQAREIRRRLDDLGLRCPSNHTAPADLSDDALPRVIELNHILGSRHVIMAHAGPQPDLDGWRRTAAALTRASTRLRSEGLSAGYHNWDVDFRPVHGVRPVDLLTGNTPREVVFELDVATCLAAGADPIAFIRANPGRIRTYHLKDWSPDPQKHYRVLLGEGIGPWKELLDVAEAVGGVEYYLIEQEGSRFPELETARRCLENLKAIRA